MVVKIHKSRVLFFKLFFSGDQSFENSRFFSFSHSHSPLSISRCSAGRNLLFSVMRRSPVCTILTILLCGTILWLYSIPLHQKYTSDTSRSRPYSYPPAVKPASEINPSKADKDVQAVDEIPTVQFIEKEHLFAETGEASESISHTSKSTSVKELWKNSWAKAYVDARPLAPKIELSRAHNNKGVSPDDNSPRIPANNRVKNSAADILDLQLAHSNFITSLGKMEKGENVFSGKGIVTVGGSSHFGPLVIGIHMLRIAGSILPVEVFLADKAEYESAICDNYLPKFNAKCVIIGDILDAQETDTLPISHYQLKSLALLFSSFKEILYFDSDSIPLINPDAELFTTEPYLSSGFVNWPDFWVASESPLFYKVAGISFPNNLPKHSSEAGQLILNKQTHIKSLLLAAYYNFYGPDYYYPLLSQGSAGEDDKETFLAATIVLGENYYRVKKSVKSVNRFNGGIKISGMIQHHPVDDFSLSTLIIRPAFLHANSPKLNAGQLVDSIDRLRLWGSKEEQILQFGHDLEKQVGKLLVKTGCELADILGEWKGRIPRLCERLHERYNATFTGPEKKV